MRKYLLAILLFCFWSCEKEQDETPSPSEQIIGYWEITERVFQSIDCDFGLGIQNTYTSSNPSVTWLMNADGTWSYEEVFSNGSISNRTGTYDISGTILSITDDGTDSEGGTDFWYYDFDDDILNLTYDLECTNGGTYFRSEKWERID
mgnify:FL=1|tara:strand:- start:39 stop:482 length:444 start_codon:yes stop_codon:yes gene_type:complete